LSRAAHNGQVQPELQADGTVVYSASNPDEGALIYAASHFGHRFLRRDGKDVVVAVTARREQPLASPASGSSGSTRGGGSSSTQQGKAGEAAGGGPEENEEKKTFQIVHTFAFTSDRKRSSVVVRKETGGVVLYCKGADNVILERLDPEKNPPGLVRGVKENIAEFTRDGEPRGRAQKSASCCNGMGFQIITRGIHLERNGRG